MHHIYQRASLNQRPSKGTADINTALKNTPIPTHGRPRQIQHFHQPHNEHSVGWRWSRGPGTRPVCCYLLSTTLHCWPWPRPGVPLPSDGEGQRGCAGGARFSTIQDFLTPSGSCLLLRSRAASGAPLHSLTIHVIHDLHGLTLFCCSGTQILNRTTIEAFINVIDGLKLQAWC